MYSIVNDFAEGAVSALFRAVFDVVSHEMGTRGCSSSSSSRSLPVAYIFNALIKEVIYPMKALISIDIKR